MTDHAGLFHMSQTAVKKLAQGTMPHSLLYPLLLVLGKEVFPSCIIIKKIEMISATTDPAFKFFCERPKEHLSPVRSDFSLKCNKAKGYFSMPLL